MTMFSQEWLWCSSCCCQWQLIGGSSHLLALLASCLLQFWHQVPAPQVFHILLNFRVKITIETSMETAMLGGQTFQIWLIWLSNSVASPVHVRRTDFPMGRPMGVFGNPCCWLPNVTITTCFREIFLCFQCCSYQKKWLPVWLMSSCKQPPFLHLCNHCVCLCGRVGFGLWLSTMTINPFDLRNIQRDSTDFLSGCLDWEKDAVKGQKFWVKTINSLVSVQFNFSIWRLTCTVVNVCWSKAVQHWHTWKEVVWSDCQRCAEAMIWVCCVNPFWDAVDFEFLFCMTSPMQFILTTFHWDSEIERSERWTEPTFGEGPACGFDHIVLHGASAAKAGHHSERELSLIGDCWDDDEVFDDSRLACMITVTKEWTAWLSLCLIELCVMSHETVVLPVSLVLAC